ncbi:MFS transporter [Geodermatophilus sp. SYSU D00697]
MFALSFTLLLSDHMSRHVLTAVLPLVGEEFGLSDTQLGALTGVVAVGVAVLSVPLSLLADRVGRARAVQAMAVVWSLATLACALAGSYEQLLAARTVLGIGEAAYASAGLALVLTVVPAARRAVIAGAFLAGASLGVVLGVLLGGVVAAAYGWRWSFAVMAAVGLALAGLHALVVTDRRVADRVVPAPDDGPAAEADGGRARLTALVPSPSLLCAYLGSGLQLFVAGALIAWLPTYLTRTHHLSTDRAALVAAAVLLCIGLGMVGCGWATDAASRTRPDGRWTTAVAYCLASLACLGSAFSLGPGGAQLVLLAVGAFFVAGIAGAAGALVTAMTAESLRATGLGVFALANNLLGLAAGSFVVGLLADRVGLAEAMRAAPLVSVAAVVVLLLGRRAARGTRPPVPRETVRRG